MVDKKCNYYNYSRNPFVCTILSEPNPKIILGVFCFFYIVTLISEIKLASLARKKCPINLLLKAFFSFIFS